ncbi:hypothetical protein [Bradyrhizobium sp.]|uniref:hypothetical protein n=1 Tax=Bradyrhizobium sp. TaxID=376 RepID=UPI003C726784
MKPRTLLIAVVLLGLSAAAGAATPQTEVMAPIRLFIDNFNKGDMKAGAAALAPAGIVAIDDVPPHVWAGPNALDAWTKALAAADEAAGNTDGAVALGKPVRVIVGADRAYVVASVVYTFKQKGVAMREPAQVVCALQKGSTGWLIAGWTWVGTAPKPAAGASK